MKPVAYVPIIFLIVTVLLTLVLGDTISSMVPKEQFGMVAMVIWGFGIVLGLTAGFLYQKRPGYLKMRPIFYWPLIGFLAAIFTKGATAPNAFYYVFLFWVGLGLIIGFLVEWRHRVSKKKS